MISKKILKDYDFDTIEQYYDYIVDSFINGQVKKAKKLTKELSNKQQIEGLEYIEILLNNWDLSTSSNVSPTLKSVIKLIQQSV